MWKWCTFPYYAEGSTTPYIPLVKSTGTYNDVHYKLNKLQSHYHVIASYTVYVASLTLCHLDSRYNTNIKIKQQSYINVYFLLYIITYFYT